jgi:predicted nucleic acid-binding Zn ribbon protein
MSAVMARIGGDARALEQRVFDRYGVVVGELLRQRTQPESLKGATLYVRVGSSAIAHQVTILRAEIVGKLAEALGPGVVTDIRTRVGPLRAA